MNSLEVLLSVFKDGEYISKNVIASRIRDSPYPLRSIDLVSYLSALLSNNPKCFNSKQGVSRARLYSRSSIGDSLLTEKVLDEIILAHLPTDKYVGIRGVISRTRISKGKLKPRLLSLVKEGRLVRRTNYEKEKETHYLKLEIEAIPKSKPAVNTPKALPLPLPPEKPKPTFPILRRKNAYTRS